MYLCEDMEMEPIMAVWAGSASLVKVEICFLKSFTQAIRLMGRGFPMMS